MNAEAPSDSAALAHEVDANFEAFEQLLGSILVEHRYRFALMRRRGIVAFFEQPGEAYRAGLSRFPDGLFSIQEVDDQPVNLGIYSCFLSHV